uniref:Retrotransposon gag domain-containing protein n=1 Tax=Nicotiana tabacum TaxID=4097 RepID=A0A1S4CV66_TOBAC|nr:PREDICTED: uncharacterized protein LOC107822937 [Nicotiana tabacum]
MNPNLHRREGERCMPRSSLRTGELFEGLSHPEKAFRALNRANKNNKQLKQKDQLKSKMDNVDDINGNNRNDHVDPSNGVIQVETFQITNNMLHLLQNKGLFSGLYIEDPQQHLKNFISICVTQRQLNVTPEAIKLLLFPFSVTGEAQTWLNSLPINSISTWEELVKQFLNKFYSPNKIARQIDEILQFRQKPTETLQETWESLKANVDTSAGGAFLSKTFTECKILLDKMAQNSSWMTRGTTLTSIVHYVAIDPNNSNAENIATLMTQMSLLTKKIDEMGTKQVHIIDTTNGGLQGGQQWGLVPNQQYRPNQPQHNPNPGSARPQGQVVRYQRQHGYNQQHQQRLAYQPPHQQQDINMIEIRDMLQQLIGTNGKMQEKLAAHDSTIKGIETQLGQLSMALNNRPQGTLPADTNINPKEHNPNQLMTVSLKNGRDLDRELGVAQSRRETTPTTPVTLEVDESAEFTEVVIEQAQVDKGKEKEGEQL